MVYADTDDHLEENKQKILRWLKPVDHSELQATAFRRREPGTGDWFFNSSEFNNWKYHPSASLWMNGSGMVLLGVIDDIITNLEKLVVERPSSFRLL